MKKGQILSIFSICLAVVLYGTGCSDSSAKNGGPPLEKAPGGTSQATFPPHVKQLQVPDLGALARDVHQADIPKPLGEYRISGEKRYNSWFLSADHIIFGPDAKLIFTKSAIQNRRNLFILAHTLTSEDQERPGKITWETSDLSSPSEGGSAAAGADNGQSESVLGGNGTVGATGATGDRGNDAPSLTVIVQKIENPLSVELAGQNGGIGGKGQNGGRGGGGGHGPPASQNAFNCNRGAGNGASGGAGGNGGNGGLGGIGGGGGTFTLVMPEDQLPLGTRLIKANLLGGDGGMGGPGGDQGAGGAGGAGGAQQLPYCRGDGSAGPTGASGRPGGSGDTGQKGAEGDFFVGNVTPDIAKALSQQ